MFAGDVIQRCSESSFMCSTGHCIMNRFVCDGKPDCPEGADELPSLCGELTVVTHVR